MDPLKMYFLLKLGIFHGYVSLPEGMSKVSIPSEKHGILLKKTFESSSPTHFGPTSNPANALYVKKLTSKGFI